MRGKCWGSWGILGPYRRADCGWKPSPEQICNTGEPTSQCSTCLEAAVGKLWCAVGSTIQVWVSASVMLTQWWNGLAAPPPANIPIVTVASLVTVTVLNTGSPDSWNFHSGLPWVGVRELHTTVVAIMNLRLACFSSSSGFIFSSCFWASPHRLTTCT